MTYMTFTQISTTVDADTALLFSLMANRKQALDGDGTSKALQGLLPELEVTAPCNLWLEESTPSDEESRLKLLAGGPRTFALPHHARHMKCHPKNKT